MKTIKKFLRRVEDRFWVSSFQWLLMLSGTINIIKPLCQALSPLSLSSSCHSLPVPRSGPHSKPNVREFHKLRNVLTDLQKLNSNN